MMFMIMMDMLRTLPFKSYYVMFTSVTLPNLVPQSIRSSRP